MGIIHGKDVLEQGYLSEYALTVAVKNGTVIALNANTLEPVEWEKIQKLFNIYKRQALTPRTMVSHHFAKEFFEGKYDKRDFPPLFIVTPNEEWDFNGKPHTSKRLELNDLILALVENRKILIPHRQFKEFSEGWGIKTMIRYVKLSAFHIDEINSLIATNDLPYDKKKRNERTPPPQKGLNPKKEQKYLRVIGALLQKHYFKEKDGKATHTPSATTIANNIVTFLSINDYTDDGLKVGTIAKMIPKTLEEIKNNKI